MDALQNFINNSKQEIYPFKRDAFYTIIEQLKVKDIIYLLGPRKSGKTVILKQLNNSKLFNLEYINFKSYIGEDSLEITKRIEEDIINGVNKVYLLDEVTYMFCPEGEIARIAEVYNDAKETVTKVILTGSQSIAIEQWGI